MVVVNLILVTSKSRKWNSLAYQEAHPICPLGFRVTPSISWGICTVTLVSRKPFGRLRDVFTSASSEIAVAGEEASADRAVPL